MSKILFRSRAVAAFTLLLFFALPLYPQALAPNLHPQFLNSSGQPLAGGFLYSYAAGTSTLQATYADSGLTIQNANPIPLDATGSPSNSSGAQVEIWLSNNSYKFCAYDSSNVQQWCADNINSYLQLLNQANTWTFAQTLTQALTITATDNQLIFGAPGNQTTLDLPPPTGNVTLHMPNVSDTIVGRATTDTLTNKTIVAPTITAGGSWAGSPSIPTAVMNGVNPQVGTTYTVAATDEQKLVTFNNASAIAVTLPQATTSGFGAGTKFSFRNIGLGGVTITPSAGQIDGAASLVLSSGQGIDIYSDGANYWSQRGSPQGSTFPATVYNTAPAAGSASIAPITMATAGASGNTYRFLYYVDQTALGASCTGNTTITPNIIFNDPNLVSSSTIAFTSLSIVNNGVVGPVSVPGNVEYDMTFRVKASTNVQFSVTYAGGSGCSPNPAFQIYPVLLQLTSN